MDDNHDNFMSDIIARGTNTITTFMWQPAQENTVLSPKPIHFGYSAIIKYHHVVSCRVNAR
jgi:hypothetical protein